MADGFIANLGISTSMHAEIWGAILKLSLAWELGHRDVIIQLDSKTLVDLIHRGQVLARYAPMFQKLWQILDRDWRAEVQHVLREANRSADYLANMGHEIEIGVTWLEHPPAHLH